MELCVHHRGALIGLLSLLGGVACTELSSGPPAVPWVPDAKVDVDVNGDGLADIVLAGVEGYQSDCPINSGCRAKLQVWFGNPEWAVDGFAPSQDLPDTFGVITAAGDVNGDGYTDLWGRRGHATQGPSGGLMLGGPGGLSGEVREMPAPIALMGDVNCDGFSDYDTRDGLVYGGSDLDGLSVAMAQEGPRFEAYPAGANTGGWAVPVGDVDGDGCSDLVVQGELVLGSAAGMAPSGLYPAISALPEPGHNDTNGDGLADVIVEGSVWFGDGSGVLVEDVALGLAGAPNAATGDVTGDGQADFLWPVSDPDLRASDADSQYDDILEDGAFLYGLYRGGEELLSPDPTPWFVQTADDAVLDFVLTTNATQVDANPFAFYPTFWGQQMGSVGDFDGDGYRDYLIMALHYGYLYRGGDRLDRRDNAADGTVHLGVSGPASVAGMPPELPAIR